MVDDERIIQRSEPIPGLTPAGETLLLNLDAALHARTAQERTTRFSNLQTIIVLMLKEAGVKERLLERLEIRLLSSLSTHETPRETGSDKGLNKAVSIFTRIFGTKPLERVDLFLEPHPIRALSSQPA